MVCSPYRQHIEFIICQIFLSYIIVLIVFVTATDAIKKTPRKEGKYFLLSFYLFI